ncbi:MAG: ABC transporter ATP-binding protein [Sphaerobacter sp.]|nr:ABC transporter ATP-binding protein [Sphaerobacter sp.]
MTATAQSAAGAGAGQSDAILEVLHLTRAFGGVTAVNDCSFQVRRGTITGLIGPNGAGKTTAFNLISGFLKPTSGTVIFDGERIDGQPPHVIARKGLVRTFQIPRPLGAMTVLENLVLVSAGQEGERVWNVWFRPGRVGQREREIIDRALAVLEYVDLIHLRDEYAANLSGGQKKLLELARALMAEPRLILLDEPGAGVNRTLLRRLVGYIEELCFARGITMFIIEHDMDLVARLCNPVIVMSEGTRLTEGTPEEVRNNPAVLEAYLGGQYR